MIFLKKRSVLSCLVRKKNKKHYFQEERNRYLDNLDPSFGQLFIFNEIQKEKYGYDAAIVYWCKFMKTPDEVIMILKGR